MDVLTISATDFTPAICFNLEKRKLTFDGVSRPEDVIKFYQPAIQWLKDVERNLNQSEMRYSIPSLHIEFRFSYFNSASAKMILQILQILKEISDKGIDLIIDWFYDQNDESMYEDGMDLSDTVNIPFNYHPC
jgi:hypothetical protein